MCTYTERYIYILSKNVCLILWVFPDRKIKGVKNHAISYLSAKLLQSCRTLWDYSLPDSSVHGIFQARIVEWVAMPSSRGSSQPRDRTCISQHLLHWQVGSLPLAPPGKPNYAHDHSYIYGNTWIKTLCRHMRKKQLLWVCLSCYQNNSVCKSCEINFALAASLWLWYLPDSKCFPFEFKT